MANKKKREEFEPSVAQKEQVNNEDIATTPPPAEEAPQMSASPQGAAVDIREVLKNVPKKQVIDKQKVQEATQILKKYKEGKANLEQRIIDNEQWYKLRHWECMRKNKNEELQPASAWLFNCIANKHADAMDNFPSPNILPREEGDKGQAQILSSIVPVILDQNDFEKTYSEQHRLEG